MVRRQRSVNGYSSTLNGAITAGATSMIVTSATGLPTEGDFYLDIAGEIVKVTNVSGTTLTIVRGEEGTTGVSHADGSAVTDVITKGEFENRANEQMGLLALPYGRIQKWDGTTLTTLTATDFTLVNTGTGTSVQDGEDGTITFNAKDMSGNDATGAVRAFGTATDHRITAHIGCAAMEEGSPDILHFNTRQNTGGQMYGLELTPRLDISATQRGTYLVSPTKNVSHGVGGRTDFWARLEIEWNVVASTDHLRFYYSKDGVNWWLLRTETFAAATTQVGIWMTNITGTLGNMRSVIFSWFEEEVTF